MISTTSEYALRALAHLSRMPEESAILGRDLARSTEVPANYLSKILLALRNAGYLTTARGSGGGYRLCKSPDEIYLMEIVELFEGSKAKPVCFLSRSKPCGDMGACTAHKSWRELSMAYRGFLLSTNISMISGADRRMKRSVEVDATGDPKTTTVLAALASLAH